MLCSLIADLVNREVKCGECLYEILIAEKDEFVNVTLFCFRVLARCCALRLRIRLLPR